MLIKKRISIILYFASWRENRQHIKLIFFFGIFKESENIRGHLLSENIVIVHLGQYWRFYFPCFFGTRGGRSPTPSAKRTGRKTNNIARGAHIAYCTEGKTQVFQTIGHEIVPKDEHLRKNGGTCILFFPRQHAAKPKMRVFFLF